MGIHTCESVVVGRSVGICVCVRMCGFMQCTCMRVYGCYVCMCAYVYVPVPVPVHVHVCMFV